MSIGATLLQTRWVVRAPIWLFRARLGFLFGHRMVLVEHIGRVSGRRRFVVVEAVARPTPASIVVASGFGTSAQWYRNLRAHPQCRVSIGLRYQVPATATPLDETARQGVLTEYKTRNPRAYHKLNGIIEESTGSSIDDVPLLELAWRT